MEPNWPDGTTNQLIHNRQLDMEPNIKRTIMIVDDHPMVLAGMESIIRNIPDMEVVYKAKDAPDAISWLRINEADLVLTDIHLPEISGVDLCAKIKQEFPATKVVGMSTFNDQFLIGKLISNGAVGFISKGASAEEIAEVLEGAFNNQILIKAGTKNHQPNPSANPDRIVVTRREKEILLLISEGLTTKEIADKVFVSPNTIESHRKNMLEKFEVLNAASLITKASKMGLI
jgi:two-component system, NarL family, nitrate/nitrite response regulator NarL